MVLTPKLYDYYRSVCGQESQPLKKVREETKRLSSSQMLSLPEVTHFLQFLIQVTGSKKILEIGTFTGYTTLALAAVLPNQGHIITCEKDSRVLEMAKRFWEESGYDKRITARQGPALETLEELLKTEGSVFDFIFMDADKRNYPAYYELSLKLLRPGGLLAIDNVLGYSGVYVAEVQNPLTAALHALNLHIAQDERVHFSVLPIGDGVTLVHKK
jgi:predicted O-methyltransferase YrrM